MKKGFRSFAWAFAFAASSAAAIDVVQSPTNPDVYTGQFEARYFDAGQHITTWEFVSPVPGTLSFELFGTGHVQLIGYQFDRGPVLDFGGFPPNLVTGIPITTGPHELLVGYQAEPQLPPRTSVEGGFTGTLTIVSSIPEPETWMLLLGGLLATATARRGQGSRATSSESLGGA
jgi:hypothetical protein